MCKKLQEWLWRVKTAAIKASTVMFLLAQQRRRRDGNIKRINKLMTLNCLRFAEITKLTGIMMELPSFNGHLFLSSVVVH